VPGVLLDDVSFGAFHLAWDKYDFLVYVARVGFAEFQVEPLLTISRSRSQLNGLS
jgi:hypothetical protein